MRLCCLALLSGLFSPQLFAVSVIDDLGHRIELKQPAQRVIALAPHIVEVVYAVGGGDQLVAAVSYSDYPEAAKTKPRVGGYKNFSVEAVLRLKPDLILAWHTGNGVEKIKQFEDLGLTVYWTEPHTLEGVSKSLRDIATLLGAEKPNFEADKFDKTLQQLRKNYSHKAAVSVFYQVWNQPLQTLNGQHLLSDVIRLCGGRNIFEDAISLAPKISVESILRANPQVIVASGMGEERPEWLDEWRRWSQLQAVKHNQLYFIPPDIIQRHTPRLLSGAEMLCKQLDQAREVYQ